MFIFRDTAGQERFETLTKQYYRRAQGVLLVYDISSEATFRHMARWVTYIKEVRSLSLLALTLVDNPHLSVLSKQC